MKKIILDYSKWRCGREGANRLGEGETQLLNKEGFMCCLGQQALQEREDLDENALLGWWVPESIGCLIPLLTLKHEDGDILNTSFADIAMRINDNHTTTPAEKITQLTTLLAEHDRELIVINQPNS